MQTVTLPAGWEHHAAPAATLFDGFGPPLILWGIAALALLAGLLCLRARPRLAVVAAVVATLLLGVAANGLVDDAYIQFRYAANLAAGRGPVFNPGERIEGASGGAWIGLVAGVAAATGSDAARTGRWLSLLMAVAATLAAAACGRAVAGGRSIAGARGAAAAALLWAALPTPALYAATGLETAAFAAALWLTGACATTERGLAAALAAALAATLRPEGFVLALGAAPGWKGLGRGGRAAVLGGLSGAALITAARLLYYGAPLPRPVLVKGVIAAAGPEAGLRYAAQAAFEWWPLLPLAVWGLLRRPRSIVALLPGLAWGAFVVARGGDWMPGGRYFLPLLVFMTAIAAWGAAGATEPDSRAARGARVLLAAAMVWGLVLLMPREQPFEEGSANPAGRSWRAMAEHRVQSRWWEGIGTFVRQRFPPTTTLATGPSGALPYASRLRTFDLYGLCSPVTHPREGGEAGHRLWGLRDAVAARADLIYPGQGLLVVETEADVVAAARQHFADSPDVLERYRALPIAHTPEYHLDFLRDVLWVRREFAWDVARAAPPVPSPAR